MEGEETLSEDFQDPSPPEVPEVKVEVVKLEASDVELISFQDNYQQIDGESETATTDPTAAEEEEEEENEVDEVVSVNNNNYNNPSGISVVDFFTPPPPPTVSIGLLNRRPKVKDNDLMVRSLVPKEIPQAQQQQSQLHVTTGHTSKRKQKFVQLSYDPVPEPPPVLEKITELDTREEERSPIRSPPILKAEVIVSSTISAVKEPSIKIIPMSRLRSPSPEPISESSCQPKVQVKKHGKKSMQQVQRKKSVEQNKENNSQFLCLTGEDEIQLYCLKCFTTFTSLKKLLDHLKSKTNAKDKDAHSSSSSSAFVVDDLSLNLNNLNDNSNNNTNNTNHNNNNNNSSDISEMVTLPKRRRRKRKAKLVAEGTSSPVPSSQVRRRKRQRRTIPEPLVSCELCKEYFLASDLKSHIDSVHVDLDLDTLDKDGNKNNDNANHSKQTNSRGSRSGLKTPLDKFPGAKVGQQFMCSFPNCNKYFSSLNQLNIHEAKVGHENAHLCKRKQRTFICEGCGEAFRSLEKFQDHEETCNSHCNEDSRIPCPYPGCSALFLQNSSLSTHWEKIHGNNNHSYHNKEGDDDTVNFIVNDLKEECHSDADKPNNCLDDGPKFVIENVVGGYHSFIGEDKEDNGEAEEKDPFAELESLPHNYC